MNNNYTLLLRWIVSHVLVFSLVFTTTIFPMNVVAKDELKGLKLNSIGLLVAGLAAPAFYIDCKSQMSAKIFAGVSLIYIAGEAMNFSKYSDETGINTDEVEAIEAEASTSPINLQIETLRFAAKEKDNQYKAAKKKGSLIQIVGVGYGIAAAVAFYEKNIETIALDIARADSIVVPPKFPQGPVVYGSENSTYTATLMAGKWSTCDGKDPGWGEDMMDEDGNLTPDGKKAGEEQATIDYENCLNSEGGSEAACLKMKPENYIASAAQKNVKELENNFQECLNSINGDRSKCKLEEEAFRVAKREKCLESSVGLVGADKQLCDYEAIQETERILASESEEEEEPVEDENTDLSSCESLSGPVEIMTCECRLLPTQAEQNLCLKGIPRHPVPTFVSDTPALDALLLGDYAILLRRYNKCSEFTSFLLVEFYDYAYSAAMKAMCPKIIAGAALSDLEKKEFCGFYKGLPGVTGVEQECRALNNSSSSYKNSLEDNKINNFDSYIVFSEKMDSFETKRDHSLTLDEYQNLRDYASESDLKNTDWNEHLTKVFETASEIVIPKAQAQDLGSLGLTGGIGALFLQIFTGNSLLGKYIKRWDGSKRAIAFGAMAALALLTGSQVKSGAKQLKEERDIYISLADKLEGEANNTAVQTDDAENSEDLALAGGGGGSFMNVPGGSNNLVTTDAGPGQTGISNPSLVPASKTYLNSAQVNCMGPGIANVDVECSCAKTGTCRKSMLSASTSGFSANSPVSLGLEALSSVDSNLNVGLLDKALANEATLNAIAPSVSGIISSSEEGVNAARVRDGKAPIPFDKAISKTIDDINTAARTTLRTAPGHFKSNFNKIFGRSGNRLGKVNKNVAFKYRKKARKLNYSKSRSAKSRGSKINEFNFKSTGSNKSISEKGFVSSERALAGFKVDNNEVSENSNGSIFKMISNRYMKSGLKRLLERESNPTK